MRCFFSGGDEEDRTLDLTDANRTLSQLSYAPTINKVYYNKTVGICKGFLDLILQKVLLLDQR